MTNPILHSEDRTTKQQSKQLYTLTAKDQAKDGIRRQLKTADSQTTSDDNLRLASLLVSFNVSVRSARAALRASITHWAADIIIGDPGETAFNPAENNNHKFTINHFQQRTEKRKLITNIQKRNYNENSNERNYTSIPIVVYD